MSFSWWRRSMFAAATALSTAALVWGVGNWQSGAIGQESKVSASRTVPEKAGA